MVRGQFQVIDCHGFSTVVKRGQESFDGERLSWIRLDRLHVLSKLLLHFLHVVRLSGDLGAVFLDMCIGFIGGAGYWLIRGIIGIIGDLGFVEGPRW